LPGKNIRPLGGLPLIGHTIRAAQAAACLDRLWVSTDDPRTAAIAESFGVKVPWLRPRALATDSSSMVDVLRHLLQKLAKDEGYRPDAVMILQPTSPFRKPETLGKAVALFRRFKGETVISVTPAHSHPHWSYRLIGRGAVLAPFIDGLGLPVPRQKLPEAYCLDGSMCVIGRETFLRNGAFFSARDHALIVPPEEAVDIDTSFDWMLAEALWARRAAQPTSRRGAYVIAEAGVNHNGDLGMACRLIEAAKAAGADAVKFQTFKADRLVACGTPKARYQEETAPDAADQADLLRKLELDESAHRVLQKEARRQGIQFLSTPFDEPSADMLERLGVPLFKLSSGEVTNKPLLEHVARKGRPIILSTGMSTLEEVGRAVAWIQAVSKAPLTLLHCVSEYPAPFDQINLRAMDTMRAAFGLPVGYSDHTPGIDISLAAVARSACVIEKHLTLDQSLPGPDHRASLEPAAFAALVRGVRAVESALGDGIKRPQPCETGNKAVGRRSLVAAKPLQRGHRLKRSDLVFKRPGHGISPADLESALGKRLKRGVGADEVLTWKVLA
jgi:N-acetylneuraminate synthase